MDKSVSLSSVESDSLSFVFFDQLLSRFQSSLAMHAVIYALVAPYLLSQSVRAACTASSSSTTDLQSALQQGGDGYTLQLCAGDTYNLDQVLNYTAPNQVSSDFSSPLTASAS